jgi:hypothetical protein
VPFTPLVKAYEVTQEANDVVVSLMGPHVILVQTPVGADQIPFKLQDLVGRVVALYPGRQVPFTPLVKAYEVTQEANDVVVSLMGPHVI